MPVIKYRQLNEDNRIIGESHPKSVLTDAEVDAIRESHEVDGLGPTEIGIRFGVSKHTVRDIIKYKTRAQPVSRVIKYTEPDDG